MRQQKSRGTKLKYFSQLWKYSAYFLSIEHTGKHSGRTWWNFEFLARNECWVLVSKINIELTYKTCVYMYRGFKWIPTGLQRFSNTATNPKANTVVLLSTDHLAREMAALGWPANGFCSLPAKYVFILSCIYIYTHNDNNNNNNNNT